MVAVVMLQVPTRVQKNILMVQVSFLCLFRYQQVSFLNCSIQTIKSSSFSYDYKGYKHIEAGNV